MKFRFITLLAVLCFQLNTYAMFDCDCSWDIDLVCIQTDDGTIVPFPNACWANCLGFTEDNFIDCDYDVTFDPNCGCNYDITPVCVEASNGVIILFPNSCIAECGGYDTNDFLDCNYDLPINPDCGCNYDVAEVCVEIEDGIFMPFINPCWADCMGYTEDMFVDCDTLFSGGSEAEAALEYLYAIILEDSTAFSGEEIPELNQQINSEENIINEIQIFPNPVEGNQVNLTIDMKVSNDIRIDLMSITGKLYKSISQSITKGQEVLKIEINDLPSGVYYLNIYSGIHSSTMKFVKK